MPTTSPEPELEVMVNSANLRSGPGTNYNIVDIVEQGDVLHVLASNEDRTWYNIRLDDGTKAWIAGSVTESLNAINIVDVPVAVTIPPAPTPIPATATFEPLVDSIEIVSISPSPGTVITNQNISVVVRYSLVSSESGRINVWARSFHNDSCTDTGDRAGGNYFIVTQGTGTQDQVIRNDSLPRITGFIGIGASYQTGGSASDFNYGARCYPIR
jgi:hypothetical protein